jgi:alpha-methylacyl-CoA racemase
MSGPLAGVTVIEMAGLGPVPFAGMMLADMGARVIRIDRPPRSQDQGGMRDLLSRRTDVLARGRESVVLDLKQPRSREVVLGLVARADALIEGFRPGVMESLGLSPGECLARRASLVYGRGTGWGQDGPLAHTAGHDINFTALSGALHSMARPGQPPVPAPGLAGDFGGGGMLLAFGVVCALLEAGRSGQGQVVDASACEGSALLASLIYGWHSAGIWSSQAGTNNGDGGAHFYDTYACADGRHIAVGAMEPAFYATLRERCGLDDPAFDRQWDAAAWPELKNRMARLFSTRTRDEWCRLLDGTDACVSPVLDLDEAPRHPQHVARRSFVEVDGLVRPAPAPRFSRTPPRSDATCGEVGAQTEAVLREFGIS